MTVKEAKAIAKEWVEKKAAEYPDFFGAYRIGSINHMKDDDLFPPTSDVDFAIVLDRDLPSRAQSVNTGEFREIDFVYKGVILSLMYSSKKWLLRGEKPQGRIMAYNWIVPNAILDPTGHLAQIQREVADHFTEKKWVLMRCDNTRKAVLGCLGSARESQGVYSGYKDQFLLSVAVFLFFGLSFLAQIPCIADLKGITAKKAFVQSRKTLNLYGENRLFNSLLNVLGSTKMSEEQAYAFFHELIEAHDYAVRILRTPFPGDFKVCKAARPLVIDGTRQLLEEGYYREVVYWLAICRSWTQAAIDNDAPPDEKKKFREGYYGLLSALGYAAEEDLEKKMAEAEKLIPAVMKVAERIAEKVGR